MVRPDSSRCRVDSPDVEHVSVPNPAHFSTADIDMHRRFAAMAIPPIGPFGPAGQHPEGIVGSSTFVKADMLGVYGEPT
jgi:hypothetical protein